MSIRPGESEGVLMFAQFTLNGIDLDVRSTHGFIAHADEVVSEVLLRTVYNAKGVCARINTRDEADMTAHKDDFFFDCGNGMFDHHSATDKEITYPNGIILSSIGKILEAAVNDGKLTRFVADYLLMNGLYALQAQDNGQDSNEFYRPFQVITLMSEKDTDFEYLVSLAQTIFDKLLADAKTAEQNWPVFCKQASQMKDGIICSEHMNAFGLFACMWNAEHECNRVLFHVFPSIRGGFMGETVKQFSGSFIDICSFAQEDKAATPDAVFVHNSGFLCQAETEEGVLRMIESAMTRACDVARA